MKRICFHHIDGDGYCAGAIVGNQFDWDVEMIPIDYGWDFPMEKIDSDTEVYMVDFCLEPFDLMAELYERAGNFVWIDHHDSQFKYYDRWSKETGNSMMGARDKKVAACELTWRYFHQDEEMPRAVSLLADYDMWKHDDPEVLNFQYGFKTASHMDPSDPESHSIWDQLLHKDTKEQCDIFRAILVMGEAVNQYITMQNDRLAKSIAYQVKLGDVPFIAANIAGVNSYFFNSVLDKFPEAVAVMTFAYSSERWIVRLYSINGREHPHLGRIADTYGKLPDGGGGGGRAGAAGFQWHSQELPFATPISYPNRRD